MKKKVLITFGTRPEAIKMVPVHKIFEKDRSLSTKLCVTAQHREMLDQVLELFEVRPDLDLDLMENSQGLYDITAKVLKGMGSILRKEKPDLVMVHGDTTTTFATSLAAFYEKIPVAHVEAGLRTWKKYSPWPEEMNRQLTARLADWHFTPTENSRTNLLNEHVPDKTISVTGNTVIDALTLITGRLEKDDAFKKEVEKELSEYISPEISRGKYILVTGHRRENFGKGFENICEALKNIADKYPAINIIYPVHLNPNVQKPVNEILKTRDNIKLIPPLTYGLFVYLMKNAHIVITDSGGIQEEAPSLGKPVLVMRDTTERPEALEAGTVRLVGTDPSIILNETSLLIENNEEYKKMATSENPYGDGKASERIAEFLKKHRF
ncbi:MAG: UDP-N-acetylglucosamine 2-epimerase (non-hydrolyzing) [bacterium]